MKVKKAIKRLEKTKEIWEQRLIWDSEDDAAIKEIKNLNTIIAALKKRISSPPKDDGAFGKCPDCGYEFNSELLEEYNLKFCPDCGKKISMTAPGQEREKKEASWKNHLMDRFGRCE